MGWELYCCESAILCKLHCILESCWTVTFSLCSRFIAGKMFSCIECESDFQREPCWIHAQIICDRKTTPLAVASLPEILYFEPSDLEENGLLSDCKSVHTNVSIPANTVFGPLLAPLYRSNAPSDDDNPDRTDLQCFQLDNDYFCNWMKYVRFAPSREEQNLAVVLRGEDVVFVTTRPILSGEELKIYYSEELEEDAFIWQNDGLSGMIDSCGRVGDEPSGSHFSDAETNALLTSQMPDGLHVDSWCLEAASIRGAREYQLLPRDETLLPAENIDNMVNVGTSSRPKYRRSGQDSDVTYEESDEMMSDSSSGTSTSVRSGTKRKKMGKTELSTSQTTGLPETPDQMDTGKRRRGRPRKVCTAEKADESLTNGENLPKRPRGRPRKHPKPDVNAGSPHPAVRLAKPPKPKRLTKTAKFRARRKATEVSTGDTGEEPKKCQKKEDLIKRPNRLRGADYDAFLYRIPCPDCPLYFYSRVILSIHRYQHGIEPEGTAGVPDMKCIDCEYTATNVADLSKHMDQHGMAVDATAEVVPPEHRSHASCYLYACERGGCWKWFCTETQLKQHTLLHFPALPVDFHGLLCSQCGYTARNAGELAEHVTEHGRTLKDKFYCGICQRGLSDSQSLMEHSKNHHKDYYKKISLDFTYQCSFCSVRFPTQVSRRRHACKNKRPQCYMCAKQFPDVKRLKAHVPSHEINGKYPCPSCDFLSVSSTAIIAHIAKAHDTSSYPVCPICQKVVKNFARMDEHMMTHNNTMKFVCPQCGKRYNTAKYLKRHRQYMHGTEMRERIKRKLAEKLKRGEVPARNTKGLRLEDYPFRCEECRVGFLREGPHAKHMYAKHLLL